MIRDAALYLATPDDLRLARQTVAGRPLAFRIVMAAVRAGVQRVAVPNVLRDPALETALARSPSARAAIHWVQGDAPAPSGPIVLLPATTLITAPVVASLAASPATRAVVATRDAASPVAAATPGVIAPIWPALVRGDAVGAALAKALRDSAADDAATLGLVAPIRTPESAAAAEERLLSTLGSPIDTRFDRAFHRRLSRPITRWATAHGVTANAITVTSIAVGFLAAVAIASDGIAGAILGVLLYAVAVVLDHADGEVARLAFAESAFGEWLDVGGDTLVHASLVAGMGMTAERAADAGFAMGLVAAVGVIASAWVAKTAPPAGNAVNRAFGALGNRDGFYVMLVAFLLALATAPSLLPALMVLVALGTHAYWIGMVITKGA